MGPPHGNCGSKALRYFPEIPYSYALCLVQCDLNFATEICGCVPVRWAYLFPGNSTGKHFSPKISRRSVVIWSFHWNAIEITCTSNIEAYCCVKGTSLKMTNMSLSDLIKESIFSVVFLISPCERDTRPCVIFTILIQTCL